MFLLARHLFGGCRLPLLRLFGIVRRLFLLQWRNARENYGLYLLARICAATDHDANKGNGKCEHKEQPPDLAALHYCLSVAIMQAAVASECGSMLRMAGNAELLRRHGKSR